LYFAGVAGAAEGAEVVICFLSSYV